MRRFFVCLLFLAGCAVPRRAPEEKTVPQAAAPSHPWREMIVYVPQTDDSAAVWLKWFVKHPNLRMVIAMSPRFQHIAKDPQIKSQLLALQKENRLELALQIPNAPILPLLLENPPYGYPDDVVQLIAQSKAGFFKQWNVLPRGLVLPYGAASPKLISLLEKLGFSWVVGSLEAPAGDGLLQSGSLLIWDATPASPQPSPDGRGRQRLGEGTLVRVWDERSLKERPLEPWILESKAKNGGFLLPQDSGIEPVAINPKMVFKLRTWTEGDVSMWFGSPAKNSAWSALQKTREELERYKNSGQASVQRLDVAFEEIYSAQNSNYFASIGNTTLSPALVEEREHEFQATLLSVYRVMRQQPPEDLFKATEAGITSSARFSSTTIRAESLKDGREHVVIEEAVGDVLVPNGPDLKSLEVWAASDLIHWGVNLDPMTPTASVDIYVVLNGQPNAGTPSFLSA